MPVGGKPPRYFGGTTRRLLATSPRTRAAAHWQPIANDTRAAAHWHPARQRRAPEDTPNAIVTRYKIAMASKQTTVDFILEQMADAGDVSARKMFGEYGVYCGAKVVALVCDDQLFVKPTGAGKTFIGKVTEGLPYPGAKPWFAVGGSHWENSEWLSELMRLTANELPMPKPKLKKASAKAAKSKLANPKRTTSKTAKSKLAKPKPTAAKRPKPKTEPKASQRHPKKPSRRA